MQEVVVVFIFFLRSLLQEIFKTYTGWWFGTFFIFPYIGNGIIPIDDHIFQRGGPTTNQGAFWLLHPVGLSPPIARAVKVESA